MQGAWAGAVLAQGPGSEPELSSPELPLLPRGCLGVALPWAPVSSEVMGFSMGNLPGTSREVHSPFPNQTDLASAAGPTRYPLTPPVPGAVGWRSKVWLLRLRPSLGGSTRSWHIPSSFPPAGRLCLGSPRPRQRSPEPGLGGTGIAQADPVDEGEVNGSFACERTG